MARVRSAHAIGRYYHYYDPSLRSGYSSTSPEMKVEYWYEAPDRYRSYQGPFMPERPDPTCGVFILNGSRGVFVHDQPGNRGMVGEADPRMLTGRLLTAFSFFSQGGFLQQAAQQEQVRISLRNGAPQGSARRTIEVEHPVGASGQFRHRWTVIVDPRTDLIAGAEIVYEANRAWREDGLAWEPVSRWVLDRFEYDVKLPDGLFDLPPVSPEWRRQFGSRRVG
jgi:hypothetical protein